MELRQYMRIVLDRWWLPALLILIVLTISLPAMFTTQTPVLAASMRFAVGVVPEPKTGDYYAYDRYYTWLASEYLVDDLAEIIKSASFGQAVSDTLADAGIQVPPGAIGASTQAGKLHRILTVSITWDNEAELRQIANATAQTLEAQSGRFLAQLGSENADVHLIDPPVVMPVGKGLREQLDLPIRLFLALAAGIALAFLLDYMDTSVRSRHELEEMGLAVLAEIPRVRRWL